MPARRQRARLSLTVADDARDEQVTVVESSAVRVRERVAQLTAFVNRSWRLRRDVTRNAAWKRELAKELPEAGLVLRDVRVHLAVGSIEVRVGHEAGTPV